jgi:hypothetical protein
MSYIGSNPVTQSFIAGTDYFNGTGSQTAFTLSRSVVSVNDVQATVNNVVQVPNDAYTVSGTTITFTSAPSAGTNNVYVRYLSTTTQSITPSQNTVSYSTLNSDNQSKLGISFKNRIINGAQVIDQRNSGAAVTVNADAAFFATDRFQAAGQATDGVYTVQQSSTAPAGFANSLLATVTTADASIGSTQQYNIQQFIEGYNTADLNFGSANAKTVTLSFWVRSSVTGTFSGALRNSAANRSYPFSYTINTANTWEFETITIAGDQSGTWLTTNGTGINVIWTLGAGTSRLSTANSWQAGNYQGVTGQTQLIATVGATFYITGVQLEVGTQATTFDYRSYGTELLLCQRYFVKDLQDASSATFLIGVVNTSTSADRCGMRFPVTMRTSPTAAIGGTANPRIYDGSGAPAITSISGNTSSSFGASLSLTGSGGGLTAGRAGMIIDNNASFFTYSAEL